MSEFIIRVDVLCCVEKIVEALFDTARLFGVIIFGLLERYMKSDWIKKTVARGIIRTSWSGVEGVLIGGLARAEIDKRSVVDLGGCHMWAWNWTVRIVFRVA